MIHHAGLIARRVGGDWRGVLIEGPSGSGKSDLALRALAHGFHLVADDRVLLWKTAGRLYGRAPDSLADQIEVRGLGIVTAPARRFCEINLWAGFGVPDRMPEPATHTVSGVAVPRLQVDPLDISTPIKLALALTTFDVAHKRRI